MASQIIVSYLNILETSVVTPTTVNTSFPTARLFDRDIGKLFKGNSTPANFYIVINQNVDILEVNRLIIPAGHNLDGLTIKLQYSDTGAWAGEQVDALSWTQIANGLIDLSFSAQTRQYWRLNIASPASAPELPEMYLTSDVVFLRNPAYGAMVGKKKNIYTDMTQSGLSRKVKLGENKRVRRYDLNYITATQKSDFEAWDDLCEGVKSFYIHDIDDVCIFMELIADLEFIASGINRWSCVLDLTEVLA